MSSLTVTFSGTSSELVSTFFPPLLLSSDYEWEVCLLDMTTYNSIANVMDGVNNQLTFKNVNDDSMTTVKLPSGAYEIEDIDTFLQDKLGGADKIKLRANNNTLKTELKSSYTVVINYTEPTIAPLLGFMKEDSDSRFLEPNKWHVSNATVNIIKVNVIQVKCNIVHGSYRDGNDDHILHTFYPSVPPGFKIVEKPNNLIYLPVNVNRIDNIRVSILDQDDSIIDFRGEVITVRLHLRKREL